MSLVMSLPVEEDVARSLKCKADDEGRLLIDSAQ